MARIFYGIAGQGFGHAMRSKVVIEYLKQQGHQVEVLAYGQAFDFLQDNFHCHEISGLHLIYKKNKVDYLATIVHDTKQFPEAVKSFRRIQKLAKAFKPQIVFSDYEPMSAMLAHLKRLPLISIGNHHFITNTKIKYPKKFFSDFVTVKVITEAMAPQANAYIVTTFAREEVRGKKTFLVPPILQAEVRELKPKDGDYSLVYLTSKFNNLVKILSTIKGQKFVVYGFDQAKTEDNVIYKKFSRSGFLRDLENCKAVIANAGFTVISEALYLGKPYLAIPVKKQFEQIINGIYLQKMGYGDYSLDLTESQVETFLDNLPQYRVALKKYQKEDNTKLFKKIDELIAEYVDE